MATTSYDYFSHRAVRPTSSRTKLSSSKSPLASNNSTTSRAKHRDVDNDSGYSSRPSTSYSAATKSSERSHYPAHFSADTPISSSIAEQETTEGDENKPMSQKKASVIGSHGSHLLPERSKRLSAEEKRLFRAKLNRSTAEPKQLTKWKTYMKSVSARVDSHWTSKDNGSFQSAAMMKLKEESMGPEAMGPESMGPESTSTTAVSEEVDETALMRVRSANRENRTKPWSDRKLSTRTNSRASSAKSRRSQDYVEIHYETTLPASQWAECKPKKYVTNHRYGNHFETRLDKTGRKKFAQTPGMKFLWENNCQVWLMEKLNTVNFSSQTRRNQENEKNSAENNPDKGKIGTEPVAMTTSTQIPPKVSKRPKTAPTTSRELAAEQLHWKNRIANSENTNNVFDKFVEWSMKKQKKKYSAITIQRYARGWLVRTKIRNLKERCMAKHGCSWKKFSNEYKALLARIQRRCGEPKPSCPVTYQDVQLFMDKKEKYEKVFDEMKDSQSMLPRREITSLFRQCGLFPLEKEIKSAFRAVFKGCSIQSDVVFLLDCSASIDNAVYQMQHGLIKDIIGHCDISYDKVRAAVIPYNDNVFRVIDFDSYGSKDELLSELENLTYDTVRAYGQITRTDIALSCMTNLIQKASKSNDHIRDGSQVPKLCFAFTDGKCYHTQLTQKWAEMARKKLNVTMYAVTCSDEDKTKRYLLDIADAEERVLKLTEYKTLGLIKSAIQGQQCLKNCALCHYAQKSSVGDGVSLCSDERRGLFKHEVLELIWMVYCPPATGLKKYRDSLWMTPQIQGTESMKLSRYHPEGTDYRDCLRKAVEERILQSGKVILPTETGVRVREITDVDLAMDFIDQLCVSKLSALGLVEKVGLNVKLPAKYL